MKDGIHQTSFIDADDFEAGALGFNGAGETSGTRADHNNVGLHVWARPQLRFGQRVWN